MLGLALMAGLSGCEETRLGDEEIRVGDIERVNFAGTIIEKEVSASGPAFGGSQIFRLFVIENDERRQFFEGEDFAQFEVDGSGEKLLVQLCAGRINNARPFSVGGKYKYLEIDWNCARDLVESDAGYAVERKAQ